MLYSLTQKLPLGCQRLGLVFSKSWTSLDITFLNSNGKG
jgi:hypothetical protein